MNLNYAESLSHPTNILQEQCNHHQTDNAPLCASKRISVNRCRTSICTNTSSYATMHSISAIMHLYMLHQLSLIHPTIMLGIVGSHIQTVTIPKLYYLVLHCTSSPLADHIPASPPPSTIQTTKYNSTWHQSLTP